MYTHNVHSCTVHIIHVHTQSIHIIIHVCIIMYVPWWVGDHHSNLSCTMRVICPYTCTYTK